MTGLLCISKANLLERCKEHALLSDNRNLAILILQAEDDNESDLSHTASILFGIVKELSGAISRDIRATLDALDGPCSRLVSNSANLSSWISKLSADICEYLKLVAARRTA